MVVMDCKRIVMGVLTMFDGWGVRIWTIGHLRPFLGTKNLCVFRNPGKYSFVPKKDKIWSTANRLITSYYSVDTANHLITSYSSMGSPLPERGILAVANNTVKAWALLGGAFVVSVNIFHPIILGHRSKIIVSKRLQLPINASKAFIHQMFPSSPPNPSVSS